MRFTIITVTKNNKAGLIRAIESVRNQTYKNVEHIIVDGGSTDGSAELLRKFAVGSKEYVVESKNSGDGLLLTNYYLLRTISEPDNGIYDAINKGIKMATGDVIGLLHSDDLFADEKVLEWYGGAFAQSAGRGASAVEAVYSDLVYVRRGSELGVQSSELRVEGSELGVEDSELRVEGSELRVESSELGVEGSELRVESSELGVEGSELGNQSFNQSIIQSSSSPLPTNYYLLPTNYSTLRYWKAHKSVSHKDTGHRLPITDNLLRKGWMPPHPTLFLRKEVFEKYGLYRTDMKIAADYEMILRLFYKHKITSYYLPHTTYLMSTGGASNKSIRNIMQKSREDFRALKLNKMSFPLLTLFFKNVRKLPQFFLT